MSLLYVLFFLIVAVQPAFCYIDPGTGSMLFSVIIGLVSTLYFVGRSVLIKIQTLPFVFSKDKAALNQRRKQFVIYSEGKQYWNVFKPILDALVERNKECHYYTSDENDPGLEYKNELVLSKFIGKGNKAYAQLNMLEADVCLMTTPALDVYQLKRSKGVKHYAHIVHAVEEPLFYRLFGLDYFDSVLLTGDFQKESIRQIEKKRNLPAKELFVTGCTYLDVLKEKFDALPPVNIEKTTILISPTWGPNGLLSAYGEELLQQIIDQNYNIIIRPHPQSLIIEKEMLHELQNKFPESTSVHWDFERDNIHAIAQSSIMLSDYSGIIFDYLYLIEQPVIYTDAAFDIRMFDLSDYEGKIWKFEMYKTLCHKLEPSNFKNLTLLINSALQDKDFKEKVQIIKREGCQHPGQTGEKAAEVLIGLQERLQA